MEHILSNTQKTLNSQNTQQQFTFSQSCYSNTPISIKISSNLTGTISGTCAESYSGKMFSSRTYEIPANASNYPLSKTLSHQCANFTTTILCTVSGSKLTCSLSQSNDAYSFISCNQSGGITIEKVYQDIPAYSLSYPACQTGYSYVIRRTSSTYGTTGIIVNSPSSSGNVVIYKGDSLTITASANSGYEAPTFGLNAAGTHSISNVLRDISAIINFPGPIEYDIQTSFPSGVSFQFYELQYPSHDSFDCDGCYCYCLDGSQVSDGEDCPDIYHYWTPSKVEYGQHVSIKINVPSGKFLEKVTIGNKTFTSNTFSLTVSSNHINSNGKFVIQVTLQSATWRTIHSGSFTMNGGTSGVQRYISGLSSSRQTRITVQSGYYSAYELIESGGSYVEPEWCDGGCYCYCTDGSQVDDGQLCYEEGDSYYTTTYTNITPGTYTSSGTTISLTNDVYNGNITISANQLTFNGYKTSGSNQAKTITITKVEQWY